MKKTILNSLFLSLSLFAMEDQNGNYDNNNHDNDDIVTFQRDVWRLKERLAKTIKPKKRMPCHSKLYAMLQENARKELTEKKKLNPKQYATLNNLGRSKKKQKRKKKQSEEIIKYKKTPLCFTQGNNQEMRYLVRDPHGNNIVFGNHIATEQLSADIIENMNCMRGKRVCLESGNVSIDIYYLDTGIEAYSDKKGEMEYLTELALTKTNFFMKKLETQLAQEEVNFRKSSIKDEEKLSSIITKKKDYCLYKNLIEKYGSDLFYEKMIFTLGLQDELEEIDECEKDTVPYVTIQWIDEVSQMYGFKDKDTYYMFGVLLEPNASDAEYEFKGYKFADKLAEWKKPTFSNSEHLSPS